nr:DUF4097 family beta strand repeat protein [Cytophagales bacterium]
METEVNKKSKTWIFFIPALQKPAKTLLLLAFLAAPLVSCVDPELDTVVEVAGQFEGIQSVVVDAAFLDVRYTGVQGEQLVSMDGVIRANSDAYKIDYHVDGTILKVNVIRNGIGKIGNFRSEGYIALTGPKQVNLVVASGSGRITAANLTAETITMKVGSGTIDLADAVADHLALDASSGNINAENVEGKVHAVVSSGKILLDDVKGDVDAEATSGRITMSHVDGLVNASMSSGTMELNRVSYIGSLILSSGRVSAEQSGLCSFTYLKASSGRISIQTPNNLSDYNYDLVAGSGKVSVGDRQASGTLRIENGAPFTIKGEVNSGRIEISN